MPEDNAPEEPMTDETLAPDVAPTTEPTPEVIEAPVVDSAPEVPADGTVTPEELAAFSQQPTTPAVTPPLDSAASDPASSPFGGSSFGGAPTPDLAAPKKSPNKKKLIIVGAIIVGALALLGGGTAAAYNLWYQNPEKVVLEAASSLLQGGTSTHKISVNVTSKDMTVKLMVDAKLAESPASEADVTAAITYQGKDYKVTGSTLADKDGNLYFKLNDVKSLLTEFAGTGADFSAFNDVITKVDGQWIKVSSDDLKSVSENYGKTQTCTTNALKSLNNKATTDEILAVYKKNNFIIIGDKIGAKNINGVGSLGYNVTIDDAKAMSFYTALGQTTVGKALTACDSSFDFKTNTKAPTEKDTTALQVWSSRFGHKLTELDITGTDKDMTATIVWNPTFVKGVTVTAPSPSVPIKDVMTDIENDFTKAYSSSPLFDDSTSVSSNLTTKQNAFKLTSLL